MIITSRISVNPTDFTQDYLHWLFFRSFMYTLYTGRLCQKAASTRRKRQGQIRNTRITFSQMKIIQKLATVLAWRHKEVGTMFWGHAAKLQRTARFLAAITQRICSTVITSNEEEGTWVVLELTLNHLTRINTVLEIHKRMFRSSIHSFLCRSLCPADHMKLCQDLITVSSLKRKTELKISYSST